MGHIPIVEPGPLRYHALHDLESLWWVAAYFVINSTVVGPTDLQDKKRLLAQQAFASQLFHSDDDRREHVMTVANWFAARLKYLHPSLQRISQPLEQARGHLAAAYSRAEEDFDPIHADVVNDLYDKLAASFTEVVETTRR